MNTKSLLTRIGVPVLSLGLLGGIGATLATSASAAVKPVTVTASTHLNNHPDTTSFLSGYPLPGQDVTVTSPGGPIWSYDNATEKFTVTPGSTPGTYLVQIDYIGSFHGFADPNTGAALDSNGSVKGTIAYNVTATQDPNPANLPGQSDPSATLRQNINTLFGGSVVLANPSDPTSLMITQVGDYSFSYQNGNYVQDGTGTHGDVNGH